MRMRTAVLATLLIAAAGTAVAGGFAPVVSATLLPDVRWFDGNPKGDPDGYITVHAIGRDLRHGRFKTRKIDLFHVSNQRYKCYDRNGDYVGVSGRQTFYAWPLIDYPIHVSQRGRFSASYVGEFTGDDGVTHVYELLKVKGEITSRRRGRLTATGTYQSKSSEVDIRSGFCGDKRPVEWKAKGSRSQPPSP